MRLKPESFLNNLLNPRTSIEFTMSGELRVAPDWHAPERAIPYHKLYYVTDGAFVGKIAGKPIRVESGAMLWVMPNVTHSLWIEPGREPFSVRYFRVKLANGHQNLRLEDDALILDDAWEAGETIKQIVEELPSKLPLGEARLRALLVMLCTAAVRLRERQKVGGQILSRGQRMKLLKLVQSHASGRLTPSDLADEIGLSGDYFARVFKKSFDCSPRAWLVEQRIRAAGVQLVNSNKSVSAIAREFGYDEVFLFSRQFKKVMGIGPLGFRRAN